MTEEGNAKTRTCPKGDQALATDERSRRAIGLQTIYRPLNLISFPKSNPVSL
jgi:hypothetical protein